MTEELVIIQSRHYSGTCTEWRALEDMLVIQETVMLTRFWFEVFLI